MQYRNLGRTGVKVSQLCFGTMSFGGDADEATSAKLFHRCRDAGINFYDTADAYSAGESERILGRLIADCRDEIVLTSKVFNRMGEHENARGLSRRHIMEGIEASLSRLGTDRLDLYFAHLYDVDTPMDETLGAFDDLVRHGKVLYPAVSNWSAWQIAKSLGVCQVRGWSRFECIQPMYNLLKRQAEVEILPLAESEQIGVIPYSPLGGGYLTGKYRGKPATAGRIVDNQMYTKRYGHEEYGPITDAFIDYAEKQGAHPATLAVAWVGSHPAVTAPIIGARNLEQLEPSLAAADYVIDDAQRAQISALSIEPPPATDRSDERK